MTAGRLGRLETARVRFLDACTPPGTGLRVAAVSSEDSFETALAPALPDPAYCLPAVPGATPPLPLPTVQPGAGSALHERSDEPSPFLSSGRRASARRLRPASRHPPDTPAVRPAGHASHAAVPSSALISAAMSG